MARAMRPRFTAEAPGEAVPLAACGPAHPLVVVVAAPGEVALGCVRAAQPVALLRAHAQPEP
jgi:hypothetical protein